MGCLTTPNREKSALITKMACFGYPDPPPEVGVYENESRTMSMHLVKPAIPVAPYLGGKSKLSRLIIAQIESVPHTSYCEAFVGMGGVFLRRQKAPKTEVINDFSRDVSNLFRILQTHYVAFLDFLRWQITTRAEFDRLTDVDPETLTDIQRAARFLYLQKLAFGGKPSGRNFGVSREGMARFDLTKLVPILESAHERLSGVVIECLDYKDFIHRYDHGGALFYLDPPYYGNENDYGRGMFSREEFSKMAEILRGVKGRFILSLNDRPEVRKLFSEFKIYAVETTYTVSGSDNSKKMKEVIICNQKLPLLEGIKRG